MIEFTGERVIPGEVDVDLLNEHVARYAFAARLAGGRRVLDAGCGVGYGAARLAAEARQVVGLEIAAEAVEAARNRYGGPRLEFIQGDCRSLPFPNGSFDLVVAFEVIEHLEDWHRLLAEARRVLANWGELIVSTPNRLYYSECRDAPNPFHVHEFDYDEFCSALGQYFSNVCVFFENHTDGVVFSTAEPAPAETVIESTAADTEAAHFFVAVCSARPLRGVPAFVYVPQAGNVLREREKHIELLDGWLEESKQSLDALHRKHQELEREATEDKIRAQEVIHRLEEESAQKTEWGRQCEAEIERLKGLLVELQAAFDERSAWALKLEAERAEIEANFRRLSEEEQKVRLDLKACVDYLHAAEEDLEARTEWARTLERELTQANRRIEELTADLTAILRSPVYRVGKRLKLLPIPSSEQGKGGGGGGS